MSRTGKIARLSKPIRAELNRRLDDGEKGTELVDWLNGEPEVQAVLKWQFQGRPINEQNLCEWKQGGYADWLRHQESCDLVRRLTEQSEDLEATAGDFSVSDRFSTLLAAELARLAEALLEEITDPRERWQRLRELLQELGRLRRDDHQAARLQMDQKRWERETEHLDAQDRDREIAEEKRRATAPIWAALQVPSLAQAFGGGEKARGIAALITEITHELTPGTLTGRGRPPQPSPPPLQPDQSESNQIKPNQAEP